MKKNTLRGLFLMMILGGAFSLFAQNYTPDADHSMNGIRTSNFPKFKELVFTDIPGANLLSQPVRIDGTKFEIRTEKHGLIYPALYDWNKDGKKDLLLGEFETGQAASNIKVYLNVGTPEKPEYTGEWFYATDVNGDTLTCYQWCCIGTHPQVVDLDGDGYDDIISGQYNPGQISWWRGSEKGFLPKQFIEQKYYDMIEDGTPGVMNWSPLNNQYWNFTTARFADFNGDGLLDLFVGGSGGFRVALNEGTKEHPILGLRQFLFHVDGTILHIRRDPSVVVKTGENFMPTEVCGGDFHTYLFPYDWDHDGVLDIIIHDGYAQPGSDAFYFFRGVNTDDGIRFEHAVPLFTVADGSKSLPGCAPMLMIDDYNNDGVEDILMGLSIATINPAERAAEGGYEAYNEVNWAWLDRARLLFPGKDPGVVLRYYHYNYDSVRVALGDKVLENKRYTLRHRGYPFVFYGKPNPEKAVAKTMEAMPHEFEYDMEKMMLTYGDLSQEEQESMFRDKKSREPEVSEYRPVDYVVLAPLSSWKGLEEFTIEVKFKTLADYHVYNHAKVNSDQIPVEITFEYPEGIVEKVGELQEPETEKGVREVYVGEKAEDGSETFSFKQNFKKMEGTTFEKVKIKVKVIYQTCSSQTCLPPVEEEHTVEVIF